MRRGLYATLALLLLSAATAGPLRAQTDPADPVEVISGQPGATLLLPYFEVDLARPGGRNTIFTVNNASATAILAHVTIWSDLAVPVLAFPIYLTGFDVETVNLRALLSGQLPATASDGQDHTDTISPQGPLSQDINFASCGNFFPLPPLLPEYVAHLRATLTGKASPLWDLCAGLDHNDQVARGYVTVDTVSQCSLETPASPFFYLLGIITAHQNVLWGDFQYVTPRAVNGATFSQGGRLVAVRSFLPGPETAPGQYTFYGRYNAWTAADSRQPLATNFGVRFYSRPGPLKSPTDVIVWRDPKVNQNPFTCGTLPSWYPLSQDQIVTFDEQEEPFVFETPPVFPPPPGAMQLPFPAATQRVRVGSPELPLPFPSGVMYFNLNTFVAPAGANPPEDPAAAQAWVLTVQDPARRFNAGAEATQLDGAAKATHIIIPVF